MVSWYFIFEKTFFRRVGCFGRVRIPRDSRMGEILQRPLGRLHPKRPQNQHEPQRLDTAGPRTRRSRPSIPDEHQPNLDRQQRKHKILHDLHGRERQTSRLRRQRPTH